MLSALEKGDLGRVAATLSNRFDETMRLTQVRQIKRMMLAAGALGAMMTGSGSAVYGLFDTKEKAENCLGVLEGPGASCTSAAPAPAGPSLWNNIPQKQTQAAEPSAACLLFFRLFSRLHREGGGHLRTPLGAVPQGEAAPVLFAQQLADGEPQPKVGAAGPSAR